MPKKYYSFYGKLTVSNSPEEGTGVTHTPAIFYSDKEKFIADIRDILATMEAELEQEESENN